MLPELTTAKKVSCDQSSGFDSRRGYWGMALVSITVEDVAPGEVGVHVVTAPLLPDRPTDMTPAQRLAESLVAPYLTALADAPPYPKVRVRVNDDPERPPNPRPRKGRP